MVVGAPTPAPPPLAPAEGAEEESAAGPRLTLRRRGWRRGRRSGAVRGPGGGRTGGSAVRAAAIQLTHTEASSVYAAPPSNVVPLCSAEQSLPLWHRAAEELSPLEGVTRRADSVTQEDSCCPARQPAKSSWWALRAF